jgi:hypothetical protein
MPFGVIGYRSPANLEQDLSKRRLSVISCHGVSDVECPTSSLAVINCVATEITTDLFLMNGHAHECIPPIRFAESERILVRLVNPGSLPYVIIGKHPGLRAMICRLIVTKRPAGCKMKGDVQTASTAMR